MHSRLIQIQYYSPVTVTALIFPINLNDFRFEIFMFIFLVQLLYPIVIHPFGQFGGGKKVSEFVSLP